MVNVGDLWYRFCLFSGVMGDLFSGGVFCICMFNFVEAVWRRFGAKFGDVFPIMSYPWSMPNHVTHPPSNVCVEHLLSAVLGKEQAVRLCALMEQIGPEEEEIIMGLIQEILHSREEILQSHEQIQEKDELIAYLRRRLFGQKRERYN